MCQKKIDCSNYFWKYFRASVIHVIDSWIIITFRIVSMFRRFGGKLSENGRLLPWRSHFEFSFFATSVQAPLPSPMSVKLIGHNPYNLQNRSTFPSLWPTQLSHSNFNSRTSTTKFSPLRYTAICSRNTQNDTTTSGPSAENRHQSAQTKFRYALIIRIHSHNPAICFATKRRDPDFSIVKGR
jgi:hypothetical protein